VQLYTHTPSLDKVFSVAWLDDRRLLASTKCRSLLLLEPGSEQPARQLLEIPVPSRRLSSGGRHAASHQPAFGQTAKPSPPSPVVDDTGDGSGSPHTGGMHALSVSALGSHVACGGGSSSDVAILRADSLAAVALCVGHRDWVFSTVWIDDRWAVSGGRDKLMLLWDAQAGAGLGAGVNPARLSPAAARNAGGDKCRALAFVGGAIERLAALTTDGCLRLFDPVGGLRPAGELAMPLTSTEFTCCAAAPAEGPHAGCVAVGALGRVHLADVRAPAPAAAGELEARDGGAGVRSLSLRGHLLGVGCANGTLAFFDLRTRRSLPLSGGRSALSVGKGVYSAGGDGFLGLFNDGELGLRQAVFAHAWSPCGRLATAGGPLLAGQAGAYCAVWDA